MGAKYPMYLLADSDRGKLKEAEVSQRPRMGGTCTNDVRHGFVYERVQHVTLKSIANNPDIVEGMSRVFPDRPIIERSYSYALTVVFEDEAAHDRYQVHPVHDVFRETCGTFWSRVQIYDSITE
jgi:hypothetical protein